MPPNFSCPKYLSHHRTRKNRVSPVSRASPAHMNSPLESFGPSEPKTFDSYFLDMMYVVFMKNFHLACCNKLMAVRLISAF